MKLTFKVVSLQALSTSGETTLLPLRCWRATFLIAATNESPSMQFDGVNLYGLLSVDKNNSAGHIARFVVGGERNPDGSPIIVEKSVYFSGFYGVQSGVVIIEDFIE